MSHTSDMSESAHRFAVIGGDGRMIYLAERLAEEGFLVNLFGCGMDCLSRSEEKNGNREMHICTTWQKAMEDITALILPLPVTRDGHTVCCPRDPECIVTLEQVSEYMTHHPQVILFGGKLPEMLANNMRWRTVDYYESPLLQLRNAYVTAEAALMTAMELIDRTIRDTSFAVLGYGRIGKCLSRLLCAMGGTVTVCARREEPLLEAATEGCHPLLITEKDSMNGLHPLCRDHTVLFNTVPERILTRSFLLHLERDTLLIDLASSPFGACDGDVRDATAQNGLRYLRAPSLPGSYAPYNAGRMIAERVLDTLASEESALDYFGKGGKNL